MSATVYVVDASARRTAVKVTPGTYLREVLEQACRSKRLNADEYTLKTPSNKTIDLSQQFRLSGLSAGAKLQLTQASRSPGAVAVALQLPDSAGGGRRVDKFPSTTSLWLVLRKFEDGIAGGGAGTASQLNLTQRGVPSSDSGTGRGGGRLVYEQPCLNVGGRSVEGFEALQKTLAQLGFNDGNVAIRVSFKSTGQPLEEAMLDISKYFATVDPATENAPAPVAGSTGTAPDEHRSPVDGPVTPAAAAIAASESQPAEPDGLASSPDIARQPKPEHAESELAEPPNHAEVDASNTINGMTVYRPSSNSTPAAALAAHNEEIYEPTIDHAKAHQAALQKAGQNQRLLSDQELQEQEAAKRQRLSRIQSVVVRVRYPDQNIVETTISATETAADLYDKVTSTLVASSEPFELRYFGEKGPQTLPRSASQRLVPDLGFRGKVLVTIAWAADASLRARQGPSLKPEYLAAATELKVDLASQQAAGEARHQQAMAQPDPGEKKEGKAKGDIEAKLKKFMGFGKK